MIVGRLEQNVVDALGINMPDDPKIYLGEQNIAHMMSSHPDEYRKYGNRIELIIAEPDYVFYDKRDNTVEFIKQIVVNGEYIKLAVRATKSEKYYVRTLYVIRKERVDQYINSGALKKIY